MKPPTENLQAVGDSHGQTIRAEDDSAAHWHCPSPPNQLDPSQEEGDNGGEHRQTGPGFRLPDPTGDAITPSSNGLPQRTVTDAIELLIASMLLVWFLTDSRVPAGVLLVPALGIAVLCALRTVGAWRRWSAGEAGVAAVVLLPVCGVVLAMAPFFLNALVGAHPMV